MARCWLPASVQEDKVNTRKPLGLGRRGHLAEQEPAGRNQNHSEGYTEGREACIPHDAEMVLGWKRFCWGSSSTYLIHVFPTQSWSRERQWTWNPPASGPELHSNKALFLGLQLFLGSYCTYSPIST